MRAMRIIQTTATQWGLQLPMRALLCAAGGYGTPKQAHGQGHAGGDCTISTGAIAPRCAEPSRTRLDKESLTTGGDLCDALIG